MSSPIIKNWLKENTQGAKDTVINFAKSTLKPLLSLPNQLEKILEEPKKYREWEEGKSNDDHETRNGCF